MTELPKSLLNAAKANDLALCRKLLAEGVDVDAADDDKCTALHLAAARGHVEVCKLLIGAGAYMRSADATGWIPLHFAANFGHPMVCRLFIEAGVEIGARSSRLKTALHYAASNGKVSACRELVQSGADLLAVDQGGYKPLHEAVLHGKVEVARFFFDECGESVDQRFKGRKTLDDLAKDVNEPDMAAFLARYRLSLKTERQIEDGLQGGASVLTSSRSRGFPSL